MDGFPIDWASPSFRVQSFSLSSEFAEASNMVHRPSTARRAFTLVELLVVIGIIALLIAILLPALNKAREQGNWAACMSNLKQIGTGLLMYSNENRGYLPRPASNGMGQYYDDIIIWREPPTPPLTSPDDSVLATILNVKGEKFKTLFRCPSDNALDRRSPVGPGYHYSYTMNDYWDFITPSNNSETGVARITMPRPRLGQVIHPAERVCLVEEKNPNDGRCVHGNILSGDDALADRHA